MADLITLISHQELRDGITEVKRKIVADADSLYGDDYRPTVIPVMNGGMPFATDVILGLGDRPMKMGSIRAQSYSETSERDELVHDALELDPTLVENRDVLLVDDIIDSGCTLSAINAALWEKGPRSITNIVLLNKERVRVAEVDVHYSVFPIPDRWVVGYGLDHQDYFRNMRYIGWLKMTTEEMSMKVEDLDIRVLGRPRNV